MRLVLSIDKSSRYSLPLRHSRLYSHIHEHLFHAMHQLDWVHDVCNESLPLGTMNRFVACARKLFLEFFFPSMNSLAATAARVLAVDLKY